MTHTQGDPQTLIKPRELKRNNGCPTHRVTHRHGSSPGTQRETKSDAHSGRPTDTDQTLEPNEKQRMTHTEGDPQTLIKPRDPKRNNE